MLCAQRKSNQASVTAENEHKANGPFICPECKEEVSLKKSCMRICHFAHRPESLCSFAKPESEAHRRCKKGIFEGLIKLSNVKNAALERSLKTCRPDVSARINGIPVAIEVQLSSLSLNTIMQRTMEYARKGIYVLWILQWSPYLDSMRYSPRSWEKWLHAVYGGRVYYWLEGLKIVSYAFEPHFKHVGGNSWYSNEGTLLKSKRYKKKSKRYCIPVRGKILNLVKDFAPKEREPWSGGDFIVPKSKLFMER